MGLRRAARMDANQREIVDGLRKAGYFVWILGLPVDLLVTRPGGHFVLMEVKSDNGKQTELQKQFFQVTAGCRRFEVRSLEQSLKIAKEWT